MKYIDEINFFHDWLLTNPGISTSSRVLWYTLMHYCNKTGWKSEFNLARSALELDTGLSKDALYKARNQLQQTGRISFKMRKGNQSSVYHIIPFVSDKTTQAPTQPTTQMTTQPPTQLQTQPPTIPKLDKTRLDIEKQEKENVVVVVNKNWQKVYDCYSDNIHPVNGEVEVSKLNELTKQHGVDIVIKAITTAVERNKRSLRYIEGILRNWQTNGYDEVNNNAANKKYSGRKSAQKRNCETTPDQWESISGWG